MKATPTTLELSHTDVAKLVREAERYLAVVELFRAEGCEPRWLPTSAAP